MDIPERVYDELVRQGKEEERREKKKIRLEFITMWAVIIYAGIAAFQWCTLRDSNQISRGALTSVQRAFVNWGTIEGARRILTSGEVLGVDYDAKWINSGATPTGGMSANVDIKVSPLPLTNFALDSAYTRPPTQIFLGPKNEVTALGMFVNRDDILSAEHTILGIAPPDQRRYIYVFGRATYRDIFPDTPEHITKFCFNIRPTTIDQPIGQETITNYILCQDYNCADKQCEQKK